MTKTLQHLLVIISVIIAVTANAQNNDPCGCDKALPDGLRDEITSIYKINLDSSLSIIYSRSYNYWENGEWKSDQSMQSGGQAYYDMFSGFLNGSQSEEQKHSQFQKDSTDFQLNKHLSFSEYKYLAQKTASLTAYTAWSNCKHDCPYLEECVLQKHPQIAGQLTIDLFCKSQHVYPPIRITHIEHPNVIIVSGQLKEKQKIKWGQTYSGTFKLINPHQSGLVKINLENNWQTDEVIIPSTSEILDTLLQDTVVSIKNGFLNANSRMGSSWSKVDQNPVDQWFNLPINDNTRKYDGAWLTTKAETNSNLSKDYYSWTLDIENHFGAKTNTDGSGNSFAGVYPLYRTVINLPTLENYSNLHYTVILKCEMHVDFHPPYAPNYPYRGKVELSGKDLDTSFSIQMDSSVAASLKIENIPPGIYRLEMSGYNEGVSAAGFAVPTGLPQQTAEGSYIIKLVANVSTFGQRITPPPPKPVPSKNYLIYYLSGAVLLIGLILFFVFRRKKN